ncbi:CarR protein [Amycolatopsis methanolica 239]|uniref:CarR protein n=1 Tax=Amycolatopsis methanolica 239 TaxID=1068978 RepID=A0A076MS23_AMYME|nr:CarR protein [Amycolatopsis methanolica 239]
MGERAPTSSHTGTRFGAAQDRIRRPVAVSPLKTTFAIRRLLARSRPTPSPRPVTMLNTPGGITSPITSASFSTDHDASDTGLSTEQLPAASAGARFHAATSTGKCTGRNWATTPSGSRN